MTNTICRTAALALVALSSLGLLLPAGCGNESPAKHQGPSELSWNSVNDFVYQLQPSSYTRNVISNLDIFKKAGRLVLVIDYVGRQDMIDDFYSKAAERGYLPYAIVRDLDELIINPGHEPD